MADAVQINTHQEASVDNIFSNTFEVEYVELPFEKDNPENSPPIILSQPNFEKNSFQQKKEALNSEMDNAEQSVGESLNELNKEPSEELKISSLSKVKSRPRMKYNLSENRLVPLENIEQINSHELINDEDINKSSLNKRVKLEKVKPREILNGVSFCTDSIPQNKKLIGLLKRNLSGSSTFSPKFDLYLSEESTYIISCKKKPWRLNSNYIFGTNTNSLDEESSDSAGVLKSNFSGSTWNVYESQENGEILSTISYVNEITCSFSPRQIEVYVISPELKYKDLDGFQSGSNKNLKELYEEGQNKRERKILKLVTKKPTWSVEKEQWVMNFHGRALKSSIKNMILVEADHQSREVMILAKSDTDEFNIDIMYPLSPLVGLSIAASSFDFKLVSQ